MLASRNCSANCGLHLICLGNDLPVAEPENGEAQLMQHHVSPPIVHCLLTAVVFKPVGFNHEPVTDERVDSPDITDHYLGAEREVHRPQQNAQVALDPGLCARVDRSLQTCTASVCVQQDGLELVRFQHALPEHRVANRDGIGGCEACDGTAHSVLRWIHRLQNCGWRARQAMVEDVRASLAGASETDVQSASIVRLPHSLRESLGARECATCTHRGDCCGGGVCLCVPASSDKSEARVEELTAKPDAVFRWDSAEGHDAVACFKVVLEFLHSRYLSALGQLLAPVIHSFGCE